MSGWDVMAEPFSTAARLALIMLMALRVRAVAKRTWRNRRKVVADVEGRRSGAVSDTSIVSAYNDALLTGWPAGELATFGEVAGRVGTSSDHVRTVIARHWAA